MFECRYCTTIFPTLPQQGGCPRCGGPNPKNLEPEVVRVVETRYIYIPQQDYYTPRLSYYPIRSARSTFFGAFGYKVGTAILILLAIAFTYWQVSIAFFTQENKPYNGPVIATLQPTKPFAEPTKSFSNVEFLSAKDSETLRTKENAINVAIIGDGYGVRYMAKFAVILELKTWRQTEQVFGITGYSPAENTFTIKVNDVAYHLNKQQGFILANRPGKIYIVDQDNAIWENDFSEALLVPISDAQAQLETPIAPNPNLSLTLK